MVFGEQGKGERRSLGCRPDSQENSRWGGNGKRSVLSIN